MEYRLLIVFEAIEILDGLPRSTRRNLLAQIGKPRFAPERFSDYSDNDRGGRRVEVSVFAGHCVHYWIDSANRHVKVPKIRLTAR